MRPGARPALTLASNGGVHRVPASCFADRLSDLIELSPAERQTLDKLEDRERHLKRGAILLRERDPANELFTLRSGTMMSYVLLDNGSRQILRFLFPGDLLGISSLVYRDAPENITALTDCTVCPFEKSALTRLVVDHPRLAALIVAYNQIERMMLTDRLAALGRTSAKARVAALLLEIRNRRRMSDRTIGDTFALGLTQEEIGDATGLTSVHVNRMFRQLQEDGLIARDNGRVTIRDERALARAANFVDRYKNLDLSWLPPAR
ncbi:Crp/Fnr family transcriptional regulator [Sphingomonas koreensis]|nr:Crp/Fnr family transcriptional regulator [Sphingomonas koreensis]